jgi:hypothetical protein
MDQTKPDQLSPHRVYFTEFDRVTYSQVAWTPEDVEEIKQNLTRKLKLLTLTKGHVVIAASHLLESELAREIILPYPELISEQVIVPALREDYASCQSFLDAKQESDSPREATLYRGGQQREVAQLIDSAGLIVRWSPSQTSDWFKNRLLADLRSENSLVTCHLHRKGLHVPEAIFVELDHLSSFSRGMIYKVTQQHDNLMLREIINGYADFLYYLSGARAVHSEGVLPQENIVDFSISDLQDNRCPLSEHEVFFKIFIDAVKAATSTHFPTDLLDAMTIPDTVRLHHIAVEDAFILKYNGIQEKTKEALNILDPDRLVLLMQEILAFERDLHRQFSAEIDSELPVKLRQMRVSQLTNLIHALANLVILPYGALVGMKDILISGLRVLKRDTLASDIQSRIDRGLDALNRCAGGAFGGERPVLLRFIDELKSEYVKRLSNSGS